MEGSTGGGHSWGSAEACGGYEGTSEGIQGEHFGAGGLVVDYVQVG